MYKIVSVKDRDGNDKVEFYAETKSKHPSMSGEILYPEMTCRPGGYLYLAWNDDSGKMLRTSTIEKYQDNGDKIEVITRNSIYILERVM